MLIRRVMRKAVIAAMPTRKMPTATRYQMRPGGAAAGRRGDAHALSSTFSATLVSALSR